VFKHEFPLAEELIYLNHAAVAPWPKRTAEAVKAFARENLHRGAQHYPQWLRVEHELREALAWLINAPSAQDIALLKNTSEALSLVAYGLDWVAGDNMVSIAQEFPSNRIVWESLADKGVELRLLDLAQTADPEQALFDLCDEKTRLVSVSSVQYASGMRADIEKIGAFCRKNRILFCVDAIQGLGALPFDVQACQADFVMADGHKWMLGPEGLALFYCRAEVRERLTLQQFGWHMVDQPGNYDRTAWVPSPTATRFECGSPNMLGIYALNASLSLLREVGMETIQARIMANTGLLMDRLPRIEGCTLLSPSDEFRRSGIVTFNIEGIDPGALHTHLMAKGVICAQRGGGIRFSPHFYIEPGQIEAAVGIVEDYCK
jgi:selenocysteine lyase/cysteine desulfurase